MASNIVLALVIGGQLTTMGSYKSMSECNTEAQAWKDQGVVAVCHTAKTPEESFKEVEENMGRVQKLMVKFIASMPQ